MKTRKIKYVVFSIFSMFVVTACAVGNFIDVPDTSGCIRNCNENNKVCLKEEQKCPLGDACFETLEKCFNDANSCNHNCKDCEDKLTCQDENDCRNACGDLATSCTNKIQDCVDLKETCLRAEVTHKEECLNGEEGFVECVAQCIEVIEEELD